MFETFKLRRKNFLFLWIFSQKPIFKIPGMTSFWLLLVERVDDNIDIGIMTPFRSYNRIMCFTTVPLAVGLLLQHISQQRCSRYARAALKWTSITYIFSNIFYTILLDIIIFFSFPFPMFWLVRLENWKGNRIKTHKECFEF